MPSVRWRRRSRYGAEVAGNAAPRSADVHKLRLVLRRAVRPGDGAGHSLRGTRTADWPKNVPDRILEPEFMQQLANAKSNLPEHGDGAHIYEKWVKPAVVDIERVAGHYAISSLFENYADRTGIYCYAGRETQVRHRSGRQDASRPQAARTSIPRSRRNRRLSIFQCSFGRPQRHRRGPARRRSAGRVREEDRTRPLPGRTRRSDPVARSNLRQTHFLACANCSAMSNERLQTSS